MDRSSIRELAFKLVYSVEIQKTDDIEEASQFRMRGY